MQSWLTTNTHGAEQLNELLVLNVSLLWVGFFLPTTHILDMLFPFEFEAYQNPTFPGIK